MLKESLKEWAKKTWELGRSSPPQLLLFSSFHPPAHPFCQALPALSKSDMGDLLYWKAPGTRKNYFIFPATDIRKTEKSWQYFYFSHIKLLFGVNILMHTVTIMYLNLITIFVVSWNDLLIKSPALWVYSVCVCSVLHWNLASLPKSHLAFCYPVCIFLASGKRGPSHMHIFFLLFYFFV